VVWIPAKLPLVIGFIQQDLNRILPTQRKPPSVIPKVVNTRADVLEELQFIYRGMEVAQIKHSHDITRKEVAMKKYKENLWNLDKRDDTKYAEGFWE
jgi:hypothetical protein